MTAVSDGWVRNYVDGSHVDPEPDHSFDNLDPATGRLVARVHEADAALVDRAVGAARRALDNGWADTPVRERAALLRWAADRIEERFEEFVAAEIADTGKPITQARELDVARAAANFRSFADTVAAAGQESFLTDLAGGRQATPWPRRRC